MRYGYVTSGRSWSARARTTSQTTSMGQARGPRDVHQSRYNSDTPRYLSYTYHTARIPTTTAICQRREDEIRRPTALGVRDRIGPTRCNAATPTNRSANTTWPTPGKKGNSKNHRKEGQNVLYGDGHVEWQKTNRLRRRTATTSGTSKRQTRPATCSRRTTRQDSVLQVENWPVSTQPNPQ